MTGFGHIFSDVVSTLILLVPAFIWTRLLTTSTRGLIVLSNTLLLTVTIVSIPVFTICLLGRQFIDATWVTGVAISVTVLGISTAFFQGKLSLLRTALRTLEWPRWDRLALLFAGITAVFYLVNYDRDHFQYGCINGVVMQALTSEAANAFDPHGDKDENAVESEDWGAPVATTSSQMNLLDVHGTGQRLGTTAIISPVVALFDVFGFRLIYALLPCICLLFGYRLVLAITGDNLAACGAAAVAVLNPYVSKIVILDENVMAFSFATAALALLVERSQTTKRSDTMILAGIAFGAALGIRHIDLPFIFTALVLIGRKPRSISRFLIAAVIAAAPCALHHHFTYGSVFQHEHFVDEVFQSWPHAIFGYEFQYTGLLNWPFFTEYIRTPYNPLPTIFYYPLNMLTHLGSVISAAAIMGGFVLMFRQHRLAFALLLWFLPQYALLAVLENWMDPNKLGVIISLFPILVVCLGMGLHQMRHSRGIGMAVAITAGLSLLSSYSAQVRFPDDTRFYEKYPRVRKERAEYYDYERELLATGSPFPSGYFFQQYTRFHLADRLQMLGQDWLDRRFRRPAAPIESYEGDTVNLSIDLSTPLMGRSRITERGHVPHVPIVDAVGASTQIAVSGLKGWENELTTEALVARNKTNSVAIYLRFGEDGFADVSSDRVYSLEQRTRPSLKHLTISASYLNLTVRPGDRVQIYETVCLDEVLVYVWEIDVSDGDLNEYPPRKMFHN